jgi:Mg-chelatase subunit ChlD
VATSGLDVLMILDESGSIANSNATDEVIEAYTTFVTALANTGSRVAVVEFSQVARLAVDSYVTVTDQTLGDTFLPYIDDDYNPSGNTNWEDALRAARYFLPRPSNSKPHLVMFITDGDPTEAIDWNRVT